MNNTVRTYLRTSKNSCRKFQIPVHTSMFCSCSPVLNGSSLSVARSARSGAVGRFAFGRGIFLHWLDIQMGRLKEMEWNFYNVYCVRNGSNGVGNLWKSPCFLFTICFLCYEQKLHCLSGTRVCSFCECF